MIDERLKDLPVLCHLRQFKRHQSPRVQYNKNKIGIIVATQRVEMRETKSEMDEVFLITGFSK